MRMPRFTTGRLMLLVALAAGFSWIYASVRNPHSLFAGTACLALMASLAVLPWQGLRGDRRLAARTLAVSSVLAFIPLAALGVFALNFLAALYKLMVGLLFLPFVFGSGVAWANLASSPGAEGRRSPLAAWSRVAVLFALPVSMMYSQWPMWASFAVSRPALDRLADRLASGEKLASPEWAGLFLVRKVARADVGPGNLALVVANDSTGKTWLIRAATPETEPTSPPQTLWNDRIIRPGRWWYCEVD